jgi:hypothetical protein
MQQYAMAKYGENVLIIFPFVGVRAKVIIIKIITMCIDKRQSTRLCPLYHTEDLKF